MPKKRKTFNAMCEELEPRILFSAGGLDQDFAQHVGVATEVVLTNGELETLGLADSTQPLKQALNVVESDDELLVNPPSTNIEVTSGENRGSHRAIAMDAAGNTVAVWSDSARDGSGFGVFAQRFNAGGDKVGSEIQVNTDTFMDQRYATVAMDDSGRFVVAFTKSDGDSDGIYLKRFDATGAPIDTADVLVNVGETAGSQINPSVAMNGNGQMVIAWENNGATPGIHSRHFDMTAAAPGDQLPTDLIIVESSAAGNEPIVDINNSGRIVVVWEQDGDLLGRRYDHNNSTALSTRHDLNIADRDESSVTVAVQDTGEFAIAYRSDYSFIIPFDGIWVRHFDADGSAHAPAIKVSTNGQNPSIATGTDDSFIVVYEEADASGNGVYAQKFDANRAIVGSVFQVNTSTIGDQDDASIAVHDIDNFAVVWNGNGTQLDNVDANGVFKRQFGTAVSNNAPSATNLSAAESYTEDTALNLTDVVVSDVDHANTTVTLTLSDLAAGTLSTGTSGVVTSTFNAGSGVWSASGAIADVNALLASVVFTPVLNYNSNFTIATSVSDGVAPAVTGNKSISGTAENDAPVASNLNAAESYTEDTPLNLTNIVVSDVDNANTTVTLTLSGLAAGTLSTGTSGLVTSTFNAGSGVWSASGAIADVNALLAGVTFTPALNYTGIFTIDTSVSDGTAAAVLGKKTVSSVPINDAPTATNLNTAETYNEDTPLDLVDIVVSDVDDSATRVILTLSDASAGSLTTGSSGGVSSVFNASTGIWVASGAIADVNTLLANLRFVPSTDYSSDFSIQTSVDDSVNPPVTGTKFFSAIASNDAPSATNLNSGESYIEDIPFNLMSIVVSDSDSSTTTVTLTLSDSAAGSLSTATSGSVTSDFNPATGVWSASGAIADVNTLLSNIVLTPALNYNSDFTIATSVSDGLSAAVLGTKTVTATAVNDDPVAQINGPFLIDEGDPLTLQGGRSFDVDGSIVSYEWDIGANGSIDASSSSSEQTWNWNELNASGVNDDGDYQFALQVRDDQGATDSQTFIVSVNNTAPIVNLTGADSVTVNDSYTLAIDVIDPGNDVITSLAIDWGDGVVETFSSNPGSFEHVYTTESANRTIEVVVGDSDGTYPALQTAVEVTANNSPVGEIVIDISEPEVGDTLSFSSTLNDVDGISGSISYQWQRNGIDVIGANSDTYLLTEADAGATISVVASYVDDLGNPESFSSTTTVAVAPVNQSPALELSGASVSLLENIDTSSRIKLSDITILDDGLGNNSLSLSGANADLFEIDNDALYLKAGVILDFETLERLEIFVTVDDAAIGSTPDDSKVFVINVEDVDESEFFFPPPNSPETKQELPSSDDGADSSANELGKREDNTEEGNAEEQSLVKNTPSDFLNRLPGAGGASAFVSDSAVNNETIAVHDALNDLITGGVFVEREPNGVSQQQVNVNILERLLDLNLDDGSLRNAQLLVEELSSVDPMTDFSLLDNSAFVDGLDNARYEMLEFSDSDKMVVGRSLMATTSLSVGYVVWLIRGSVLLSSLLTSLPAWRIIDPLPVLSGALGHSDDDEESLQSIVEGKQDQAPDIEPKEDNVEP